jgi:hypothetical protein
VSCAHPMLRRGRPPLGRDDDRLTRLGRPRRLLRAVPRPSSIAATNRGVPCSSLTSHRIAEPTIPRLQLLRWPQRTHVRCPHLSPPAIRLGGHAADNMRSPHRGARGTWSLPGDWGWAPRCCRSGFVAAGSLSGARVGKSGGSGCAGSTQRAGPVPPTRPIITSSPPALAA